MSKRLRQPGELLRRIFKTRIDRIVADVQALSRDPDANAEAIRRVHEALPQQ